MNLTLTKLDIGTTLRKYRINYGYTQQNLADSLDISRESYKKWEANKVDFSISQLSKISQFYNIPIHQIITTSDEYPMKTKSPSA